MQSNNFTKLEAHMKKQAGRGPWWRPLLAHPRTKGQTNRPSSNLSSLLGLRGNYCVQKREKPSAQYLLWHNVKYYPGKSLEENCDNWVLWHYPPGIFWHLFGPLKLWMSIQKLLVELPCILCTLSQKAKTITVLTLGKNNIWCVTNLQFIYFTKSKDNLLVVVLICLCIGVTAHMARQG